MTRTIDIVQKLWNLCNDLRDDGVTYHQYVTELTYLLFLKMAKETNQEGQLPEGYRWDDLKAKSAPDRLDHYRWHGPVLWTNLIRVPFHGECTAVVAA